MQIFLKHVLLSLAAAGVAFAALACSGTEESRPESASVAPDDLVLVDAAPPVFPGPPPRPFSPVKPIASAEAN